ncbi:MAG: SAM hydroxide adenosyltransferase [Opitutaceae bacterium]|jgi:pimeloyl-ACP methyl ester carboxylesterase
MAKRLVPTALAPALVAAALALLPALPARADDSTKVERGQIAGARFAIAVPPGEWNHRLLLLAHGYRPDSAPLVADLNPERISIKAVLDEGWMVATTSYRRNGIVIGDAIDDLDALRSYIARAYGDPERVIIEGESMGGLIATIMAERDKGLYDGAVAFDATLYIKEASSQVGLTLLPRIPLLFVATAREVAEPRSYLTALVARPPPVVQPVLFLIKRVGHTNINQPEHLEAFRALNAWIDGGPDALPKPANQAVYFDATLEMDPGPSTAVILEGRHAFRTRVAEVDPVYGNILLEAQAQDFDDCGIPPMTYCTLAARGGSFRTLYGRTYTDVKTGEWVAFPDADGRTVLSRVFGDAAATARLKVGDAVTLTAIGPGGPLH